MKGRTLTFLGIIAAIVAAALIIARNHITSEGVVLTGGILFILAGISNTIAISRNRTSSVGRAFGYLTNAAAIVLGICMIAFQEAFVPLVAFIFGLLVAMFAIWQFYVLAAGIKPYSLPAWLYVFPILLTAAAAYIILDKASLPALPIMLTTGISVAILAAGCLIEGGMLGAARHLAVKKAKSVTATDEQPHIETTETQIDTTATAHHDEAAETPKDETMKKDTEMLQ